jgi:hypothetical protein
VRTARPHGYPARLKNPAAPAIGSYRWIGCSAATGMTASWSKRAELSVLCWQAKGVV